MTSIFDQAEQTEQLFRDASIKAARKPLDTSNPSGECWHYFEPIGNERRFCDRECCDMWSKEFE